ncbi:lipoyl synthase, partial [Klebsiella pneumoniae]|nr:lipoyl synthase [Klebsiella pneumoniae]
MTKSNLILGMGETPAEVEEALVDLRNAGCDIITITQYLRPSPLHHPIDRWVRPEEFLHYADLA